MPYTSDREALIALTDSLDPAALPPSARATLDAVCCHLLGPDPTLARLRRSLCETTAYLVSLLPARAAPPGEVTRARALLQETAR